MAILTLRLLAIWNDIENEMYITLNNFYSPYLVRLLIHINNSTAYLMFHTAVVDIVSVRALNVPYTT